MLKENCHYLCLTLLPDQYTCSSDSVSLSRNRPRDREAKTWFLEGPNFFTDSSGINHGATTVGKNFSFCNDAIFKDRRFQYNSTVCLWNEWNTKLEKLTCLVFVASGYSIWASKILNFTHCTLHTFTISSINRTSK